MTDLSASMISMPESESEDEIIDRIEVALRKIADASAQVPRAAPRELDVSALTQSLDMLIARLRRGLEPARPADHLTE
jgi:hypothetical protein